MLRFNFSRDMNVKIHIFLSPLFVNQTKIFIISYFLSIQYPNTSKKNIFFSLSHLFFFSFLFPSLNFNQTQHKAKKGKRKGKEISFLFNFHPFWTDCQKSAQRKLFLYISFLSNQQPNRENYISSLIFSSFPSKHSENDKISRSHNNEKKVMLQLQIIVQYFYKVLLQSSWPITNITYQ